MLGCSLPNPSNLLRGKTSSRAFSVCLLELINYVSQARDASPLRNAINVEGTYIRGPNKSGGVHFKIAVESHVAFDVHAIVQKLNSYGFVSRTYHGLLNNLA